MTDSVVDLAAKDPETFRRLLREDPAFQDLTAQLLSTPMRRSSGWARSGRAFLWIRAS
jgi:hypothetical protein